MTEIKPFAVRDSDVTHAIIQIFGGDNNLSRFVPEDLQEMASGNRGRFAVLALVDYASKGGSVVELSPRAGNHVVEELGEINTGDPETLATFLARALVDLRPRRAQGHRLLGPRLGSLRRAGREPDRARTPHQYPAALPPRPVAPGPQAVSSAPRG